VRKSLFTKDLQKPSD